MRRLRFSLLVAHSENGFGKIEAGAGKSIPSVGKIEAGAPKSKAMPTKSGQLSNSRTIMPNNLELIDMLDHLLKIWQQIILT